jgi:hypothetical protein
MEGGLMVDVAQGVYVRDIGDGDVCYFLMIDEPPRGQYVLRGDVWVPLPDGFFLMDKLITGDVDTDGPLVALDR